MNRISAFVIAALTLAAFPAAARTSNSVYGLATGCSGCHGGGGTVTITQVTADPLSVGASAVFRITQQASSGGTGRHPSFAANVTTNAGTFQAGTGYEVCSGSACPNGKTAVRDVSRPLFNGTSYSWDVTLGALQAGTFTIAVGANDNNDNGSTSGDQLSSTTISFTVPPAPAEGEGEGAVAEGEGEGAVVGEGEGEGAVVGEGEGEGAAAEGEGEDDDDVPGNEDTGGCTAAPASLSFGAMLLGIGLLRRRRR